MNSGFDRLRICARDLSFDLSGVAFPTGPTAPSFILAKRAVETAAKAGYFCYDEMFVWADALIEDFPDVTSWLRSRFPLVFIDEMQDTSERQGTMLHAIFPRISPDIVVQRVGDPNQAIFDYPEAEPDKSDPFPDPIATRYLEIPNSYRFGPGLAALASPFAVKPVGNTGLCGIGPRVIDATPAECGNAIFIFPDNATAGVLDAYGQHVLTTFNDGALANGAVTAVGGVHQDAPDVVPGHDQFPKSVPHYWSGYSAEISRKDPHPKSLVQYFRTAQAAVRAGQDLAPGIEKLASGLIRLAGLIGNVDRIKRKPRTHRAITHALEDDATILAVYRRFIKTLLIDWMPLTADNWGGMQADILTITGALCEGTVNQANATSFLGWPGDGPSLSVGTSMSSSNAIPNVYRFSLGTRSVDIRLGSIHSVKGQTHLATLLLSTYWYAHSSEQILPWLLGDKVNGNGVGPQNYKRLLQTYVAMTRPSHMICLAIPRSKLGDAQSFTQRIATLKRRGWQVAEIVEGVTTWH